LPRLPREMHSIKRLAHKAGKGKDDSTVPKDAVLEDQAAKLEEIYVSLKTTTETIKKTEKNWSMIFDAEAKSMEQAQAKYPEDDDVKAGAKLFASCCEEMKKQYLKTAHTHQEYNTVLKNVDKYLEQIKALQPDYKQLETDRVDYEMYVEKADGLEEAIEKGKNKSEKFDRNVAKRDAAKEKYETKLAEVKAKQAGVYKMRVAAFKAAFTAYFYLQALMADTMDGKGEPIYHWAEEHANQISDTSFQRLKLDA